MSRRPGSVTAMRLECTSLIACPVARLRAELARPELLQHVAAPMVVFVPIEPPRFPAAWAPGRYRTRLLIGGRVPIGIHTLNPQADLDEAAGEVWHDAGFSDLIKVWDHRILLVEVHGMTRYTDRVEIRAGALTGPAWLFAKTFYTYRQRRLDRVVASGFDYARAS